MFLLDEGGSLLQPLQTSHTPLFLIALSWTSTFNMLTEFCSVWDVDLRLFAVSLSAERSVLGVNLIGCSHWKDCGIVLTHIQMLQTRKLSGGAHTCTLCANYWHSCAAINFHIWKICFPLPSSRSHSSLVTAFPSYWKANPQVWDIFFTSTTQQNKMYLL